jgi:phosphoglycerate dehydrogenase-like enzyme
MEKLKYWLCQVKNKRRSPMRPRILLLDEPHPKARAIMEEVAELITDKANCIGAFVGLTKFTPDDVPIPVEFIACPCTGIDHITSVLNPDKAKIIHLDADWKANEGREVTSTAEHTWSLILQLAKMRRIQLNKKTIGIIGFGRIGKMVMAYADAFKMNIMLHDKTNIDYCFESSGGGCWSFKGNSLEEVLQASDITTLHIPLQGNEGFIGEKEFAMMKDGALLANTSRAEIVDEDALNNWLKQNSNNRYADDFYASHSHEFLKTWYDYDGLSDKVILTDHIAGNCFEAREATDIYIANKIKQYIEGGYQ